MSQEHYADHGIGFITDHGSLRSAMPDQEKLQELFNAALKSHHEDYTKKPDDLRAGPRPSPVATAAPVATPAALATSVQEVAEEDSPATVEKPARGLSASESEELGVLLDEQVRRRKRRHRMEALVTALVLFGMTGGGFAWFVQDSTRVQAFQEALREILWKIQDRNNQICSSPRLVPLGSPGMARTRRIVF